MTPAARLQAAIEVLDSVIVSAREDGPPADTIVTRYFKTRRYAGSKDRRAVRELVFRAIRRTAERPESGRAAVLGLAEDEPALLELFGQPRGPEPATDADEATVPVRGTVPDWLTSNISPLLSEEEWPALLERAPLDLRVNVAKVSRDEMLAQFSDATPTSLSPWGIRLQPDSRIDDHPAFEAGLIEVQDEGSQLIALACEARDGQRLLDLCAGAGGKSLALAAAAPHATILAPDSNRARLSKLGPRAERAGATIETGLLTRSRRPRPGRRALLGKRHLAAQPRGALAADARPARSARGHSRAPARHRGRAREAGRAARLCGLLAAVPRGGRSDRALPSAPFIVD